MPTTLDDRDPGFTYKGVWILQDNMTSEFDETNTATYLAKSTVSLNFAGVQITVFGTIAPSGTGLSPSSSYSIDKGPPIFFTGAQQPGVQYMQQFFQSDILSESANHTLIITTFGNNGEFSLDYVEILQATEIITPPTSIISSSSTSPGTGVPGSITTSTTSTSPTVPASGSPTAIEHSSGKKVGLGAIVGGSLGGVLGVIAVFALIIFMRKKKRGSYSYGSVTQAPSATLDGRDTANYNSHV